MVQEPEKARVQKPRGSRRNDLSLYGQHGADLQEVGGTRDVITLPQFGVFRL